jgi:hypothetical protein
MSETAEFSLAASFGFSQVLSGAKLCLARAIIRCDPGSVLDCNAAKSAEQRAVIQCATHRPPRPGTVESRSMGGCNEDPPAICGRRPRCAVKRRCRGRDNAPHRACPGPGRARPGRARPGRARPDVLDPDVLDPTCSTRRSPAPMSAGSSSPPSATSSSTSTKGSTLCRSWRSRRRPSTTAGQSSSSYARTSSSTLLAFTGISAMARCAISAT